MLIGSVLRSDFAYPQGISTLRPSLSYSVNNRDETTDRFNRTVMSHSGRSIRDLFEKRADVLGGKNAWDEILEGLAKKIGFNVIPGRAHMSIQEIWANFIKQNQPLVDKGNALIVKDIKENGNVTEETISQLRKIIRRFAFPETSGKLIKSKTDGIKGQIIDRSSGKREDSFTRNLAGIFSSPKRSCESLIIQGVKSMLEQAINVIWIQQNSSEKLIEGVPNVLIPEEGFGVLIEQFLEFDASGTAMSDLYGHTAIEAVIGDADTAVRSIYANVVQFLFRKGQESQAEVFEYNPTFLTTPYEFRLKGKEYSVVKNIDELQKAMQSYPKINGRISPVTKEQAMEINRVVNALEEEVGAALDVEWGYLNGELYILQIRPIIGDFKKPLVNIDTELAKKELITGTLSAVGHTTEKGFTGKLVLFGSGVDSKTVAKFEKEFGSEYIRVQSDVALAVVGTQTKAKVLIDPEQGSRQAHRINLITDRIAEGEFVYANGPILREGLDKNIEFIPHPELHKVWISNQDVTYFSDGLRGIFYEPDMKDEMVKINDDYDRRQAILVDFQKKVKYVFLKDDIGFGEFIWLMRVFRFGAEFDSDIFVDMWREENCNLNFVQREIMAGKYEEFDFEDAQEELDLLEEALSFPLYPSDWESSRLKSFKNILFLKGIAGKLKEAAQPRKKSVIPEQYVTLLLDQYDSRKSAQFQLVESIKDAQIIRVSPRELLKTSERVKVYPDQLSVIKTAGTVSTIYVHANGFYDSPSLFAVLIKIRQENSDALIIIDGSTISDDEFKRFESEYGRVILKAGGVFGDQEIIKFIQEDHLKWAARKKAVQQQAVTPKIQALLTESRAGETIFVINNDDANDFAAFIRDKFGDKHTVVPISFMVELEGALEERVPSIVIADTHLMGKDEWDNIYRLVSAKNPKARFILTDNEAAIFPKERVENRKVIGVIEKPFYFQGVLKVLKDVISAGPLIERPSLETQSGV